MAAMQRIQSLDRGLQILEYIAEQEEPVRLADLAGLLGVEKSSAHRLVRTLAARGYVQQDRDTTGYVLHDKVIGLASKLTSSRRLGECAGKYLRRLARETGETAHLAVAGSDGTLVVDYEHGANPVGVTSRWGRAEPFHCTAVGKALLAGLDRTEVGRFVGPGKLKRYTSRTITRLADLVRECEAVREGGIAFDRMEYRDDTNCAASPVRDVRGRVIAAIGVSGPSKRFTGRRMTAAAAGVKQAAVALSSDLGFKA